MSSTSLGRLIALTGVSRQQALHVIDALRKPGAEPRKGAPRVLCHDLRVILVMAWLRTNLTQRSVAAIFGVSQATVSRIIASLLPQLAALHHNEIPDGDENLFLDGTLIPAHDHERAAKAKNYRRSTNTQIVCDRRRKVVYVGRAWRGNRNDIVVARETVPVGRTFITDGAYRTFPGAVTPPPRTKPRQRRRHIQVRARAEHAIARLKDWAILRWIRHRGGIIDRITRAVAYLHNLRMGHIPL